MVGDISAGGPTRRKGRTQVPRGPQLTRIEIADEARAWRSAGFHVEDDGSLRLGGTQIDLVGGSGGVISLSFSPEPEVGDLDGLPLRHGQPGQTHGAIPHPNGIAAIDHVVINTGDTPRSTATLVTAGFPLRRSVSTKRFGPPMVQSFFWAGDVILEMIGPVPDDPDAISDGASIYGLTVVTSDMEHTSSFLGDALGAPRPAVQSGRLIAPLLTGQLDISPAIAVMTPHQQG